MTADTSVQTGQDPPKRNRRSKGVSKHGCTTCRIRRVKCDEGKPTCVRCTSTGRRCDGYRSNFVNTVIPSLGSESLASLVLMPGSTSSTPTNLSQLSRYFTLVPAVPTHHGAHDYYVSEAAATLDMASSESAVQHALSCLDALRTHHEKHGDPTRSYDVAARPGFQLGLKEYSEAIRALAGRMSESGVLSDRERLPAAVQTALLCSQLFISIEVALNDIQTATQHFVCGLQLMQQYGTRPYLVSSGAEDHTGIGVVVPGSASSMPDISIFVIKVYLSCPQKLFCFPENDDAGSYAVADSESTEEALLQTRRHVANIARSAVTLLQGIHGLCQSLDPSSSVNRLVSQRQDLLHQLDSARHNVGSLQRLYLNPTRLNGSKQVALAAAFTNLFYLCLRVSVILALQGPGGPPGSWADQATEMVSASAAVTRLMGK